MSTHVNLFSNCVLCYIKLSTYNFRTVSQSINIRYPISISDIDIDIRYTLLRKHLSAFANLLYRTPFVATLIAGSNHLREAVA